MKVILCTGAPQSGHEDVFGLLLQAGLTPALPTSQATLPAQDLQAKLLRSQEVSLLGEEPLGQILPGKLWHQLAAELFFANLQHPAWGWADHQTTVLMDFWKDFDPQVRLLLVYNSPQAYLAQVLDQHTPATLPLIAEKLQAWTRWNTALLRYYHRHRDRCLLVNAQQACVQPQLLVNELATHWHINTLDGTAAAVVAPPAYQPLQNYLINQIIDQQHPALSLYQELEGATLAIAMPEAQDTSNAAAAWESWVQARASHAQKISGCAAPAAAHLVPPQDNACEQARTLQEENEYLMEQLHQVQGELEHYFLRYQAHENAAALPVAGFVSDFWRIHQPQELQIDMRRNISGSNWYPPEPDGRWAGPATFSTLHMPPMQPGNYTLELDIVDAMNLDLVRNMTVEAWGKTKPVEVLFPLYQGEYPLVCQVPLSIPNSQIEQPWEIGLRFTHVVCPADSGSDDRRNMTMRLRSIKLVQTA